MLVKDVNGKEVAFEFKRLAIRKYREVLEVVEAIKEASKPSETIALIEKGLLLVVNGYDPETVELEFNTAMDVLKASIANCQVSGTERKKFE